MVRKIRIQKLDKEGIIIDDRLVDQKQEYYLGPKEPHDGPLRLEFTLFNPEDVDATVEYLMKLKGKLPLEVKDTKTRGRKKIEVPEFMDSSREQSLRESLSTAKDQDDFITKLRELGYVFMDSDRLSQILPESYTVKEKHLERYDWLIRLIKAAKDPRNDKYDPSMLIGIRIRVAEERTPKMVVYMNGQFGETISKDLPTKKMMTLKETNLIKYPHYMTYEEREKWGVEHRLLLNTPTRKPSKFYIRWAKDITVGKELEIDKNRLENE